MCKVVGVFYIFDFDVISVVFCYMNGDYIDDNFFIVCVFVELFDVEIMVLVMIGFDGEVGVWDVM